MSPDSTALATPSVRMVRYHQRPAHISADLILVEEQSIMVDMSAEGGLVVLYGGGHHWR